MGAIDQTTVDVALYDRASIGADERRTKARARCAALLRARAAKGQL